MAHHGKTPNRVLTAPKVTTTIEHPITVTRDAESGTLLFDPQPPRAYRRPQVLAGRRQARRNMKQMLVENPSDEHKVNLRSPHWMQVLKRQWAIEAAQKLAAEKEG